MLRLQKSFAAAAFIGIFTAQSLGAADMALTMGAAARMGAMYPVAGRIAPAPARKTAPAPAPKKAPAGPSLWQRLSRDLSVIAAWLEEPVPVAAPAPRVIFEDFVAPVPEPVEVPRDRMMITGTEGFIGVAPRYFETELAPPAPVRLRRIYKDRMAGLWREGKGIRFRITYLDSFGRSWIDGKGFHLAIEGSNSKLFHQKAQIPMRYWRDYPLYYAGDAVSYEIELENTGPAPLKNVRVYAKQEECLFTGNPGKPLSGLNHPDTLREVPVGVTVIKGHLTVGGAAHRGIGYEQTHLTIVANFGTTGITVLADDAEAGIIDPPGL